MATERLTVTGMTCGGCEQAVKRALGLVHGVTHVTASFRENAVTVEYDPAAVDLAAIRQKIQTLGYQVQ